MKEKIIKIKDAAISVDGLYRMTSISKYDDKIKDRYKLENLIETIKYNLSSLSTKIQKEHKDYVNKRKKTIFSMININFLLILIPLVMSFLDNGKIFITSFGNMTFSKYLLCDSLIALVPINLIYGLVLRKNQKKRDKIINDLYIEHDFLEDKLNDFVNEYKKTYNDNPSYEPDEIIKIDNSRIIELNQLLVLFKRYILNLEYVDFYQQNGYLHPQFCEHLENYEIDLLEKYLQNYLQEIPLCTIENIHEQGYCLKKVK